MQREGEAGRNWACRGRCCINNEAAMHQQPHTFSSASLLHSILCQPPVLLPISPYLSQSTANILSLCLSGLSPSFHSSQFPFSIYPFPMLHSCSLSLSFILFSLPSISLCLCSCIASLLKHGPQGCLSLSLFLCCC